jgi:hypothetical protein
MRTNTLLKGVIMQIRIPSYNEVKQKIIDHPYATYYGILGVVFVGSYAIARKSAQAWESTQYDYVLDDMYEHMRAGDHLVLTMNDEQFHYAPFTPEEQAS